MEEVPKPVRLAFIENNPTARAAAQVFQHTLVSQAGETVVHYTPTFVGYSEQVITLLVFRFFSNLLKPSLNNGTLHKIWFLAFLVSHFHFQN